MITTVTLNAAIDKTYPIPGFAVGAVQRARGTTATPGGKGLNVARVLQTLGEDAVATGFVGGHNGAWIVERLERLGLRHDFVRIEGESRICLNILDERDGAAVSTEILEEGPTVSPDELAAMKRMVERLAAASSIIVFSGSLPRGAPAGFYAELLGICAARGAVAYLDTSGAALREGLKAKPAFIKPNEDELAPLIGRSLAARGEIAAAVRKLMDGGVRTVAVTLGAAGALAGHEGRLYEAAAPAVQAVNTVGCGDAFTAGMAAAEARGEPFERRLAFATAVASAAATTSRTGEVRPQDVQALLPRVRVGRL